MKNFAFRLGEQGNWELAPAYDLVYSSGPGGEHTMTVDGEGRAPSRGHLLELAVPAGLSLREAEAIIEEVAEVVSEWGAEAGRALVGSLTKKRVENGINRCLARLDN